MDVQNAQNVQKNDDGEWKETYCTEVYLVDLPGGWEIQEETKEKLWKTTKGDIFKITKKNEAIFIKDMNESTNDDDKTGKEEIEKGLKRKKIEIKK